MDPAVVHHGWRNGCQPCTTALQGPVRNAASYPEPQTVLRASGRQPVGLGLMCCYHWLVGTTSLSAHQWGGGLVPTLAPITRLSHSPTREPTTATLCHITTSANRKHGQNRQNRNKWLFKRHRRERITSDWPESCYLNEKYREADLDIERGTLDDNSPTTPSVHQPP